MDKDTLVKLFAGAILTTLVAVIMTELRQHVETKWLIFYIYMIFAFFASGMGLLAYLRSEKALDKNDDKLASFSSELDKVKDSLSFLSDAVLNDSRLTWILSDQQVMILEKQKQTCNEIWVITEKPEEDSEGSSWAQAIKDNISDGIEYKYLCPNIKGISSALNGLKVLFKDAPELFYSFTISEEEYDRLPHRHMVVYDPDNDDGEVDALYEIEAPERGWWLRLKKEERNSLIDTLKPYMRCNE